MWDLFLLRCANSKVFGSWLYIPAVLVILIVSLFAYHFNFPISVFTRDPMAVMKGPAMVGAISNIGVMFWCFSFTTCLFSYVLLKKSSKSREVIRFILMGGALSFILLIDDLFMLHERIYPSYLGVDETIVFPVYGVFLLFYLVRFRKLIFETNFIFLLLAMLFFSISIFVDLLPESMLPWHHLYEDGSKFMGIVSWFGYQFSACYQEVRTAKFTKVPEEYMNSL